MNRFIPVAAWTGTLATAFLVGMLPPLARWLVTLVLALGVLAGAIAVNWYQQPEQAKQREERKKRGW